MSWMVWHLVGLCCAWLRRAQPNKVVLRLVAPGSLALGGAVACGRPVGHLPALRSGSGPLVKVGKRLLTSGPLLALTSDMRQSWRPCQLQNQYLHLVSTSASNRPIRTLV